MFEANFIVDAILLYAIGLWPLLVVVIAAGVRWFTARRSAAAATVHSLPQVTTGVAPARQRTLAYAAGQ